MSVEYLTAVLSPLLVHPEDLKVESTQDQLGVLLSVDVHKDDMGVVIGHAGDTVKAIRQLVRVLGFRQNARVSIKIKEPEGSDYKKKE